MRKFPTSLNIFFVLAVYMALVQPANAESNDEDIYTSTHFGVFSSTGADLAGYRKTLAIGEGLYSYYSFGLPSMVSVGFSFYENYHDNGIVLTAGHGVGTLMNLSVSYQIKIDQRHYLELGIGYGILFEGKGLIPVVSYVVHR